MNRRGSVSSCDRARRRATGGRCWTARAARRRRSRAARRSTTRTASNATARPAKATALGRVPDAAAARFHDRQVQDPLDRNRQRADRRRSDRSVRRGLYGTAMPGWDRILSDATSRRRRSTSRRCRRSSRAAAAGRSRSAPASPSSPDEHRARPAGLRQAAVRQVPRHRRPRHRRGRRPTFEDDWRQPLRAADLTEPWTFHGGATSRDIYLRFRTGMTGTPMPSFADAASDAEMWDLANYVVSLGAQAGLVDDRGRGRGSSTRGRSRGEGRTR